MQNKKNILVTGTGGRSVGSGIIHTLLYSTEEVRKRWRVIATDANPFSWGLYKADYGELLPYASDPGYIDKLTRLVDKYEIDCIIPGTQVEGEYLVNNLEKFPRTIILANRKELYPYMMDKYFMINELRRLGINYIETVKLNDWKYIVDKYGFPIVIKPTKETGGSKGLFIICDLKQLEQILHSINKKSNQCVQPYIGSSEDEYTVGVLTDKNGDLIDSIIMKRKLIGLSLLDTKKIKDKSYSISTGYSQGFIVKDEKIREFCENLAIKINSIGPLNIQLRIENDKIFVFEIHPRFSGTTPIRADVGFNEVDILLRNFIYNEKFSRINYQYNVAAIRAFEHVIVPMKEMIK